MKKVKQIVVDAVVKDQNTERDLMSNIAEDIAVEHVNEFQKGFKKVRSNINYMKEQLGKAGFKAEFEKEDYQLEVCGGEEIVTEDDLRINSIRIPAFHAGGFLTSKSEKPVTICKISKKNSDDVIVETKAETAEGDLPIDLLGKYLALARATRIILGDFNE